MSNKQMAQDIRTVPFGVDHLAERIADHLAKLGYRKQRQITTLEELDALPCGSVILDRTGLSLHKNEFTGWRASNGAKNVSREMLENEALPATVLHIGTP